MIGSFARITGRGGCLSGQGRGADGDRRVARRAGCLVVCLLGSALVGSRPGGGWIRSWSSLCPSDVCRPDGTVALGRRRLVSDRPHRRRTTPRDRRTSRGMPTLARLPDASSQALDRPAVCDSTSGARDRPRGHESARGSVDPSPPPLPSGRSSSADRRLPASDSPTHTTAICFRPAISSTVLNLDWADAANPQRKSRVGPYIFLSEC